jgi:hypothetical protein
VPQFFGAYTQREGQVGLGVQVYQQDLHTPLCQTPSQGETGGGFRHPSFMIGDRDHKHHFALLEDISKVEGEGFAVAKHRETAFPLR